MEKVRFARHLGAKRCRARRSSRAAARRRSAWLEPLEHRLALAATSPVVASPQAAESAFALYASGLYSHVLQRAIDPAAMVYWMAQLESGLPIQEMADAVSHSAEYYANLVIAPAFQQYLHRSPSAADLVFFTASLQAGTTDEEVEALVIASDEFFDRAGGTNGDWIQAVYISVLGRTADPAGSAYWLSALASGVTRDQVSLEFTAGAERESARIEGDYSQVLDEPTTAQSTTYWLSQLKFGATNEDIIGLMAATDDFFHTATGRIVTTVAQPSNASWFLPSNTQIDATAAASNPQVMFLGDSLTFGWTVFGTNAWSQYFSQFQPLNAGIPGDTTQNILWRLDNGLLANIHPKLVVLMAGVNNVPFNSAADIAAGVEAIVDKLHSVLPETKVLLMGVLPSGASVSSPARQIESDANAVLRSFANGVNTFYADITPDVLDVEGKQLTGVFFPDQVHLTDEGYKIYAQAIAPLVDQLVAQSGS